MNKENNDNLEKQTEQIDELIPPVQKIKILSGETIDLPKVTLGMELKVMRHFFEFLKIGGYSEEGITSKGVQDILLSAVSNEDGNKLILDMFSIVSGKPAEWLLENVDLAAMLECLLPFFVLRVQSLTKAMGNLGKASADIQN